MAVLENMHHELNQLHHRQRPRAIALQSEGGAALEVSHQSMGSKASYAKAQRLLQEVGTLGSYAAFPTYKGPCCCA